MRCSWGNSIPKPTESPPPSRQPRLAASITPGPPPVTTAQPPSAKRPPPPRGRAALSRARPRTDASLPAHAPSRSRRPPGDRSFPPPRNRRGTRVRSPPSSGGGARASGESGERRGPSSERPAVPSGEHARHEHHCEDHVEDDELDGAIALGSGGLHRDTLLVADARPSPRLGDRTPGCAAVEEADRKQVRSVEQEAEVGELDEQVRVACGADRPDRRGTEPAGQRSRERDERVPPRRQIQLVSHVRPEAWDERRQGDAQSLPAGLEDVAELVHEDEEDEAEPEPPVAEPV